MLLIINGRTLFNGDVCGPIAASMTESMFLLVISRWRSAFDGLKETKDYNFLSAASSILKSMECWSPYQRPKICSHILFEVFYWKVLKKKHCLTYRMEDTFCRNQLLTRLFLMMQKKLMMLCCIRKDPHDHWS